MIQKTTEQNAAILSNQSAANYPQPVDYGLTYEEICSDPSLREIRFRNKTPEGGLNYKQGDWVRFYSGRAVAIWFSLYVVGFVIFVVSNPNIPGGWGWNTRAIMLFFLLMAMPGFFPGFPIICAIVQAREQSRRRKHPSADLLA